MLKTFLYRRLTQNKGAPRLWLEGAQPERAGFIPGKRFMVTIDSEKKHLTLSLADTGYRIVSGKEKGGKRIPVIDINSHELLSLFDGMDSVRVIMTENKIHNSRRTRSLQGDPRSPCGGLVFDHSARDAGTIDLLCAVSGARPSAGKSHEKQRQYSNACGSHGPARSCLTTATASTLLRFAGGLFRAPGRVLRKDLNTLASASVLTGSTHRSRFQ